ncbi:MAG: DUF4900 domain-containing protein [Candidatus Omnitrophica bacterium]|nr:DUF4900 domain-containing protein [Candidatus Omnitrophota bacterium]MDD5352737.1 DUF4900 domain-containing protein [Candidatus Omnitrophota bacterium]MDD5550336.1 DUF4900 domain-containing protein [Candidatus Omnitrophota bacterium]
MNKLLRNEKGIILIAATLSVVVVLGFSAAFFMRSVSEKRFVDVEKFNMQAEFLAEAGANHGLSELRERIDTDLYARVSQITNANTVRAYYTNKNALGFLRDYAYSSGDTQFAIANGKATVSFSPLNLITAVSGTYTPEIIITSASNPENPSGSTFVFHYNYITRGTGTATAITPNISKQISLSGSFSVTVMPSSFANYALFTINHTSPSGGLVWFTGNTNFFGPVHTNDRFSFANNPSGHFTDQVTQHLDTARFYNNNNYIYLDDDHNSNIDVPVFDEGFQRSVDEVPIGTINHDSMQTQALGTMSQPGSDGIYVPNNAGAVTGGIYVKGDVSDFQLGADGSNNPQYTITQGSTTKIITVNYGAKTTRVQTVGGSTDTYSGLPDGNGDEGTIIYSENNINQIHGVVQRNSKVTVASEEDVVITDHIRYQDYNVGPPVNATGYNNMLGIISWGGDVRIGRDAPDNIEIHGIVMAPEGSFTVDDYRSRPSQGTATLLGGVVSKYYGPFGTFWGSWPISGYGRNFVYDARVLSGLIPPYFPTLTNFTSEQDGLDDRPTWRKN